MDRSSSFIICRPLLRYRTAKQRRSGVSILEVLFAMLVGSMGILGALALIPVAIEQTNKGREADQQAIVGQAAINEFRVRGGYLPDLWVVYDGSTFLNFDGKHWRFPLDNMGSDFAYYDTTDKNWKKQSLPPNDPAAIVNYTGSPPGQAASFCYDPLGVAYYLPGTPAYASFPYSRSSLSTFAGAGNVSVPVMIRSGMAQLNSSGRAMVNSTTSQFSSVSPQVAEAACFSHDELKMLRPKEATQAAVQVFSGINFRKELEPDRQFSWFATMCPKTDGFSDEYILSIAVVYRRPLPVGTPDNQSERIANIILADGVTGGDALLQAPNEADLDLHIGDWIMLGGTSSTTPGTNITADDSQARFRWYRVVNAEADAILNGSLWEKNVTLFGPDWDVNNYPSTKTYAVLMTGVRSVYERTVRVHRTGMWH